MREIEIFGWCVSAELQSYSVEFKVYEDSEVFAATLADAPKPVYTPWMEGCIKWDGCSNWTFPHDNYPIHFCGIDDAEKFVSLIAELYKVAAELMPDNKEHILWRFGKTPEVKTKK